MKKIIFLLILSLLLTLGTVTADGASIWTKYAAADKSYSFHYPSGWKVTSNASVIEVKNNKKDEQLIMAVLPFDPLKSPQDSAEEFIGMLKEGNPYIRASKWQSLTDAANEQVIFELSDKSGGKEYSGLGMVIKSGQSAIWFSYSAPTTDYYKIRGYNLLQGFIVSLASGTASKAPNIDYSVDVAKRIDNNAKNFMFVLEFTLGAPFTESQEGVILKDLKDIWRNLSEEELKVYDQYPTLVKTILSMKQKDLEELRANLEKSIKEWLAESDQSDQAVKIINKTLKSKCNVVLKGKPPLTEMSLTAYSELIAYSRLLKKNSKAKPEQIAQKNVNIIKKQVKKVWNSYSVEDKSDIATSPGLWICLRTLLDYGTAKEQAAIREKLMEFEAATRVISGKSNNTNADTPVNAESGTEKPMDMTSHWCMLQINQLTFNTYMWSRGFNYLPVTGPMW